MRRDVRYNYTLGVSFIGVAAVSMDVIVETSDVTRYKQHTIPTAAELIPLVQNSLKGADSEELFQPLADCIAECLDMNHSISYLSLMTEVTLTPRVAVPPAPKAPPHVYY